jgi:hypothetical protein
VIAILHDNYIRVFSGEQGQREKQERAQDDGIDFERSSLHSLLLHTVPQIY